LLRKVLGRDKPNAMPLFLLGFFSGFQADLHHKKCHNAEQIYNTLDHANPGYAAEAAAI